MPENSTSSALLPAMLWLAITLSTAILFSPALTFGFLDYDDQLYVTQNALVQRGLSLDGIRIALRPQTVVGGNWHPLTVISHMLDVSLFGLAPGAHHAVNVALHAASAGLLFLALHAMTGAIWPSAAVALLWAWHPLRVESVAWVAERKDVLSGLFWMLSLLAYAAYARHGGKTRYAIVLLCLCAGLLSKPMVVTLPLVLLLLDVWPLRRLVGVRPSHVERDHDPSQPTNERTLRPSGTTWQRLVLEKIPMLLLAAAVSLLTLAAQRQAGSLAAVDDTPLWLRASNALQSYVAYLGKTFWPTNLAVLYPLRARNFDTSTTLWAAGALVAITLIAVAGRRRWPFILIGWLWYLGTLFPVIGLVQVGSQAMADRYTYLPQIGIILAVVWFVTEISRNRPRLRYAAAATLTAALATLLPLTMHQLRCWQDTKTLFTHALQVTEKNYYAHYMVGNQYVVQGDYSQSISHYDAALAIKPNMHEAHFNKALSLLNLDQPQEELAIWHFQQALGFGHDVLKTETQLGRCLLAIGENEQAAGHLRVAVEQDPTHEPAITALGTAWLRLDRAEDVIALYQKLLGQTGNGALRLPQLAGHLAWILATHPRRELRDAQQAILLATAACEATDFRNPRLLDALAAAHAEAGNFTEALDLATQALQMIDASDDEVVRREWAEVAENLADRIPNYQRRRPYRELPPGRELW